MKFRILNDKIYPYVLQILILSWLLWSIVPQLKYVFLIALVFFIPLFFFKIRKELGVYISKSLKTSFIFLILLLIIFFLSSFGYIFKYDYFIFKQLTFAIISLILGLTLFNEDDFNSIINFSFLRVFSFIIIGISIFGLIKFALLFFDINFYMLQNEKVNGTLFQSDQNIYCLYLIIAFLILVKDNLLISSKKRCFMNNIGMIILMLSIFTTTSRRGVFLFVLINVLLFFYSVYHLSRLKQNLSYFAFILVFMSFLILLFGVSGEIRSSFIKGNDMHRKKTIITQSLIKYMHFVVEDINYQDFFTFLWRGKYNPDNPESGWGNRYHYTISTNIAGDNFNINNEAIYGYKLDSSTEAGCWNGNSYSYTVLPKVFLKKNDTLDFSAYGYASRDFNGDNFFIKIERNKDTALSDIYDLNNKGNWQKFALTISGVQDTVTPVLYFVKEGVDNFSNLKGNVIFAIPEIKLNKIFIEHYYTSSLKKDISFKSLFLPEKSKLYSSRYLRFNYAVELWDEEYTFFNKLFGKGFFYLEKYGENFFNNPQKYDYPHNPIVSAYLYSGLLGGFFYLVFLITVFYKYWIKKKFLRDYLIMYLVCFYFLMFSGNSHFSVPLFIFLSLIPLIEPIMLNKSIGNSQNDKSYKEIH